MTTSDTFTRADSTTTLGNADSGEPWTALAGTWGISSNKAYLPSPANNLVALIDVGKSDGVFECDVLYEDAGDGVFFRQSGASILDGFLVYFDNSQLNVLNPGLGSHLGLSPVASPHTPGVTYTIKVVLLGSTITIYENGALKFSSASSANLTETKVGLRSGGTTAAKRWDNLRFTPFDPHKELMPLDATWRYKQIARTDNTDYSSPSYDDSAWPLGAAGFGQTHVGGVFAYPYNTPWDLDTRLWTRYRLTLPGPVDLVFTGTVDNDIAIYWNGNLIALDTFVSGGVFAYDVPAAYQTAGDNVIAVRSTDDAGVSDPDGSFFAGQAIQPRLGGWSIDEIRF